MRNLNKYLSATAVAATVLFATACNNFLEIEPASIITPESNLTEESQLGAYAIGLHELFPSHSQWDYGIFDDDAHTDNQVKPTYNNKFVTGEYKVSSDDGNWNFENMYTTNYFLNIVLPRWKAGTISGDESLIEHYIGEVYFFRAFAHFEKLKSHGDFPIVDQCLTNDLETLIEASKRMPRNEVARFIISDLDSAIMLMQDVAPDGNKNRLSVPAAQLFKSRVALYEASWLQNFKGTAFVPGGEGWPGADKDYHQGFSYVSGSIDSEIDYFLTEAMEAADAVASTTTLTENTGHRPTEADPDNPYYFMFADEDLGAYPEILLWRDYDIGLGFTHSVNNMGAQNNYDTGITRGMVMQFLDENGLPWYAPGALFTDDNDYYSVRENRDSRIKVFLKEAGQANSWINPTLGTHGFAVEPIPIFTDASYKYCSGYAMCKGVCPDRSHYDNGYGSTGCPVYRSAEALLNYIEACYMRYGYIDTKAASYWNALRTRAGISTSYEVTVAAMDVAKEAQFDWGAYSGGQLIDQTMMAIRKERRSELMGEAMRMDDLCRWRSLDQLIDTPYHIEGMKLWNSPNYDMYTDAEKALMIYGADNSNAIISDPALGDYILPHRINGSSLAYDGLTWHMAHYLVPIEIQHMRITSETSSVEDSPIYQNPYWPTEAGQAALQ